MNYIRNGCVFFILIILASCSKNGELGPQRDVAYYKECRNERDRVIEICQNDPGKYQLHPNCVNAYGAISPLGDRDAPSCLSRMPDNYFEMTEKEKEAYHAQNKAECARKQEEYIKSRKC